MADKELVNMIKSGRSRDADFQYANLRDANLERADLVDADFRGADFTGADLRGADLSGADLSGADFYGADLSRTDLRGADFTGAYLMNATLTGSNLKGANFTGADLDSANLKIVTYDPQTKWPRGFTPPGEGRMASLASAAAVPAIGDILVSSWGYDQTNVNFYEVVGISGSMITIQEIGKRIVSDDNRGSQKVMPVPGRYTGKPMRKKHSPAFTGKYGVKIHSYAEAYLWNGKPEYQTAAGFGR